MELVAHGSQQLHNKGVSHLHAHGLIDCMQPQPQCMQSPSHSQHAACAKQQKGSLDLCRLTHLAEQILGILCIDNQSCNIYLEKSCLSL